MIIHCLMNIASYVEIMIALTLPNDIKLDDIHYSSLSLSLNIYIKII